MEQARCWRVMPNEGAAMLSSLEGISDSFLQISMNETVRPSLLCDKTTYQHLALRQQRCAYVRNPVVEILGWT